MSFIEKKSIGVDVADFSIEAAQVSKKAGKIKVEKLARIELKTGLIERGRIKDEKRLSEAVMSLFENAQPTSIKAETIVFGLPESLVFTYVFTAPMFGKNSIDDLVKEEASKNIPINKDDLLFSYKILEKRAVNDIGKNKKKIKKKFEADILLVAVSREAVLEWQKFFRKLKIEIDIFDIETLATFRGMLAQPVKQPVCVLDIGSVTTNISIFTQKGLCYSHFIKKGGELFTKNLSDIRDGLGEKNLSKEQAEMLKRQFGLSKQGKYGDEMYLILSNIMRTVVQEVKSSLIYFNKKYGVGVKEVILVGGSSKLIGMLDYFQNNLTEVGVLDQNLLKTVKVGDGNKETNDNKTNAASLDSRIKISLGKSLYINASESLEYVEAVGLALRTIDKQYRFDPAIISVELKKQEKLEIKKAKIKAKKRDQKQEEKNSWIREHKKEAQLLFVLIFGVVFIAGAFWYRDYNSKKKQAGNLYGFDSFKYENVIDYKIPIAVNSGDYNSSNVRGRIVSNEISEATESDKALLQSRAKVETELKTGEKIWGTVLNEPIKGETKIFPATYDWLVYYENDIIALVMNEVKKIMKEKKFMLSSTEKLGLENSDDNSVYYIVSKITVLTEEDMGNGYDKEKEKETAKTPEERKDLSVNSEEPKTENTQDLVQDESLSSLDDLKKALKQARSDITEGNVVIKETATGWLNVRSGPGTNYPVVKKVYEGERYFLVLEENGWIEIDLKNGETGWIYGVYVEKEGDKI